MTCIVATSRFVASDRRVTDEGHESGSLVKIAKSKHLIAATAGNCSSVLHVKALVRKGALTPEDLQEGVDKDSVALVLTPGGKLWRVVKDEAWEVTKGLDAIGTGGDLALGWLLALGCPATCEDPRACLRRALRVAASRRVDCGGGVDIRSFT